MAFVFVPNAGGGFDEGMRQTNPETEVEYIYTDGAWRPLGPKIEDQYDVLDERYINQDGDTMHGELKFDHGEATPANILIYPNIADSSSSIYALNSATLRIRSLEAENRAQGSSTHIAVGKNVIDGEPETYIYHLQDPESELHGANKRYVDEQIENINLDGEYLPLAGGDMTGNLNMKNARIDTFNSAGERTMEISPNGFMKTRDMLRVVRTDGGTAFEAREGDTTADIRAKIDSDGYWRFDGIGELKSDVRLKDRGRYIVRGTGNSNVGYFMATDDNTCQLGGYSGKTIKIKNVATPVDSTDGVNKAYVDANAAVGSTALRPPGLRFQYQSGNSFPASGTFNWFTSGGNQRMKVNATSQDFSWGTNTENVDVVYGEGHTFSIWLTVISNGVTSWKLKTTGTYNRLDFHDNDVLVYISYNAPLNDLFSTNVDYYLTLSGLF
jgi:hypothetical protein